MDRQTTTKEEAQAPFSPDNPSSPAFISPLQQQQQR